MGCDFNSPSEIPSQHNLHLFFLEKLLVVYSELVRSPVASHPTPDVPRIVNLQLAGLSLTPLTPGGPGELEQTFVRWLVQGGDVVEAKSGLSQLVP